MKIDLNADLGEAYGPWSMGDDIGLLQIISSANIACGGHAGDGATMIRTVRACLEHGVAIGAHPGFADKEGFGRRRISGLSGDDLKGMLLAQVGALAAICKAEGAQLSHIKLHGALNNMASEDLSLATECLEIFRSYDQALPSTVVATTALETAAKNLQLSHLCEIFADRHIKADGTLVPRGEINAIISDPKIAAARILDCLETGYLTSVDGCRVRVHADTVCVHGDTAGAVQLAAQLRSSLESNGVEIAKCSS